MTVDLNNPALGLPEVRPRKQFVLQAGPSKLADLEGFQPSTRRLVIGLYALRYRPAGMSKRPAVPVWRLVLLAFCFVQHLVRYAILHRVRQSINAILHDELSLV